MKEMRKNKVKKKLMENRRDIWEKQKEKKKGKMKKNNMKVNKKNKSKNMKMNMNKKEFKKKYNGLTCPEIMGLDVRKDEDNLRAFKEGIYDHFCPNMAADILEILERIVE